MAVPKRKTTKSRAGKRLSHMRLSSKNIIEDNFAAGAYNPTLSGPFKIFNIKISD